MREVRKNQEPRYEVKQSMWFNVYGLFRKNRSQ